ncbi:MAG: AAA family ATPase, partial [Lachnospiraceae bacterium]|nr:AAA family ATPase [Lachnospiraceae bacterium]
MGKYLNPGNNGFQAIRNGLYVDKTGLIDYINSTVNISPYRLTSFSRPRRFGKSFAAKMLCAYYDKSCDSRTLFEGLEISTKKSFETYLNKFDVIYLDITWFLST